MEDIYWGKTGRCAILCVKCGIEDWIMRLPENRTVGIPIHLDMECGNCGAVYCAKNREYKWLDKEGDGDEML